ncbi:MAG TPA: hypothetical protein VI231_22290 [Candidatus Binatia bacterium]|jgi:hypothetical protein
MIRNTFGSRQLAAQAVVAGDRAIATLVAGRSNRWLLITLTATLTITAAVTSIVGLGSVAQIFDSIGLDMGGDAVRVDPRHWLAIGEHLSGSKHSATRVTSLSASPVSLVEQLIIPFEYLAGGRPSETRFRENNIALGTNVVYELNGTNNGIARLVRGGTAALTNITVNVQQYYDDNVIARPPLFRPWWKPLTLNIAAASPEIPLILDLKDLCRGITIIQDSDVGMVTDVINKIGLRGSRSSIIGGGSLLNFKEWARGQEYRSGGDVFASPGGGVVHINFQESGRLANCLNPTQDASLALYFDAQPTAAAGATQTNIRVLLHLLQRNPQVRAGDGQYITAPDAMMPKDLIGLSNAA